VFLPGTQTCIQNGKHAAWPKFPIDPLLHTQEEPTAPIITD